MARKTAKLADIVDYANEILANSQDDRTDIRHGVALLLERVLMETDNYNGFRYLQEDELPNGNVPGINRESSSLRQFEKTDESRRSYFLPKSY